MKKLSLMLPILLAGISLAEKTDFYDQYGNKTGSCKTQGSTTTCYDKYGHKVSSSKVRD